MGKRCRYDEEVGELEQKTYRKPYKCDGCKMTWIGEGCRCKECDYVLHMECMYPSETLRPSLFASSNVFTFSEDPPPTPPCNKGRRCKVVHRRLCDACGKPVQGFVYHCSNQDFDLHPCCSNLKSEFTIPKYNNIEFRLKKDARSRKCDWCKSKVVAGGDKDIRGWFYESVNKEYNFHVFCIMDIAVKSCEIARNADGNFRLALEKELKDLPGVSNSRKRSRDGENMSVEIIKLVVSRVLSMVLGDPSGFAGQLLVDCSIKLVDLMYQLLRD